MKKMEEEIDIRIKDLQERRNKENNVVFIYINKQLDEFDIREIFTALGEIYIKIRAHFRVGIYSQEKTRPLIAVLDDRSVLKQLHVLRKATMIKETAPLHLRKVILTKDRTKLERTARGNTAPKRTKPVQETSLKEIDETSRRRYVPEVVTSMDTDRFDSTQIHPIHRWLI